MYMLCEGKGERFNLDFFKRLGSPMVRGDSEYVSFNKRKEFIYRFEEREDSCKNWRDGFFFISRNSAHPSFPLKWRTILGGLPKAEWKNPETHLMVL